MVHVAKEMHAWLQQPLLIGGATTSPLTGRENRPQYKGA